ncbi:(Fe-S)-binding protein [Hyphomicrobium sp.]|uniref:(Fe-S)-binding protein n=2 Tax=Hyphomicrobiales TaxID=356 RepID=UPI002D77A978|nr:(Fe-S)-binding protein [Hyphomicrobium sp.]HET6390731.1 (Fe-S)-binding protein [Hyphomicrobium sp.]
MSIAAAVTALFWVSIATLAIGLARRAALWRAGREAPIEWAGLWSLPKRYFVDLHHVVARDPYIANTHIATAGGAFAALLLVAINYGFGLYLPLLDWGILCAAAVMLTGVFFVWLRRRNPPARLSGGAWNRLPYTLAAFAIGLALVSMSPPQTVSLTIATIALLLLLAGSAELALGIGTGSPMKHAVAGLLHLAFHPRSERFAGKRSTALAPLALSNHDYGVEKPSDFLWTELLSFDACVECGKCEQSCPAFAAGQPLNPKKLIQDLVAGFSHRSDAAYAGRSYPGIPAGSHRGAPGDAIVPRLIEAETIWSCTTCRACVEECPMLIEHVDAIVGMRRNLNLTQGDVPGTAPDVLANLRETQTQGGYIKAVRYNWAIDLDVPVAEPGKPVDLLLFAGEGAFDMRYQRTLRALVKTLKAARADFAILGDREGDTGDTARRLGDEATFQTLAKQNIARLAALDFKRIVTADPHVLHSLRNEYPAFGGNYTVIHHTALLAQLVSQGKLQLTTTSEKRPLTYHDPCYLARYNGETEAPRNLLRRLGINVREMQRSGMRGRCCGGGGGAPLTDVPGKQRIPDIRMADAREAGAEVIAVACPQCTAMLEGVAGSLAEVLDIAELVASSLEAQP